MFLPHNHRDDVAAELRTGSGAKGKMDPPAGGTSCSVRHKKKDHREEAVAFFEEVGEGLLIR